MKQSSLIFFIIIGLLSSNTFCKKSDAEQPTVVLPSNLFTITALYDIGNAANAADIRAEVKLSSTAKIEDLSEVRFVLAKSSLPFTDMDIKNLKDGNYFKIPISSEAKHVIFPINTLRDISSDLIKENTEYNAYIAVIGRGNTYQVSTSKKITLLPRPVLAGDYKGVWNDALFQNFKVTMKVNDDYTGSIYYSDNFMPCCGVGGDGTIKFTVSGQSISSFIVNQYLGLYKGGHCEAQYTAIGTIQDNILLSITGLTGTDCDGNHTPGTIIFTKQ